MTTREARARRRGGWLLLLAAALVALAPFGAVLHEEHAGAGCALCHGVAQPVLEASRGAALPAAGDSATAPLPRTTPPQATPFRTDVRLSRSCLANVRMIARFSPMPGGSLLATLVNGAELGVSRSQARALRDGPLRL